MKFLLDENLPDRLVGQLVDLFPGSRHVKQEGLRQADDDRVWAAARDGGFVLLTKDKDFQQRSVLHGPPPKVIWPRMGNHWTRDIADLIRANVTSIEAFGRNEELSLLVLLPGARE